MTIFNILFSDHRRHYANIQETLATIVTEAYKMLGDIEIAPMITVPCYYTTGNDDFQYKIVRIYQNFIVIR